MITILKGDTSPDVSVVLAEGFDYSGATVHVEYQGVRKCFASCKAGDVLTFCFTAEETSPMAFGLHPISVRIVRPNGSIVTVQNSKTAIRVTDDPAEVHADGMIAVDVKGGLFGIQDLPERWTEADLVAKIREILKRGGAITCALFLLLPAFCAEVHTAPKGKIYNDAPVVTNVTFSGLAKQKDIENLPTAVTVTNIARSVVNSVWDGALNVAWEARMHNGHLYYIAVTNQPVEVK